MELGERLPVDINADISRAEANLSGSRKYYNQEQRKPVDHFV
jgi:hypothetical protein